MNTLVIAVLLGGAACFAAMRREVFPEFDLEIVLVSVPYPGATPEEVEEGICQKIEESCRSVVGIKKLTSVAQEGMGYCIFELADNVKEVQKVLGEIRSEVERIPSMPDLAEDPKVEQVTLKTPAIKVGILAPKLPDGEDVSEGELRDVAEVVRDDLLALPAVSAANLLGAKDYEIDIELSESSLRKYGLSLQKVAGIVRRENLELPGGTIRSESGEILLRGKNKRYVGEEIAKLPLVTLPDGLVLTVGDLGTVRDEFADVAATNRINGRQGMVISIDRSSGEDLLAMVAAVKKYVADVKLPPGYELTVWADQSIDVQDRLDMLLSNGLQGLTIVFVMLALFLDLKIAFWVAMGIPFSMLGTGALMFGTDQTLNMLSMFAFLMAIGIVVDDAIVVSDNVDRHRRMGKSLERAAIDGTVEVIPSVISSVLTTVITFLPLCYVSGVMGKFIAVMPFAFICTLLVSLAESTLVLPGHLAHEKNLVFTIFGIVLYPLRILLPVIGWSQQACDRGLKWFVKKLYAPFLEFALDNRLTVLATAVGILLIAVGVVRSGITPLSAFSQDRCEPAAGEDRVSRRHAGERDGGGHEADRGGRRDNRAQVLREGHPDHGTRASDRRAGHGTGTGGARCADERQPRGRGGPGTRRGREAERHERAVHQRMATSGRGISWHGVADLRHRKYRTGRKAGGIQAAGAVRARGHAADGGGRRTLQGMAHAVSRCDRHRRRLPAGQVGIPDQGEAAG